MLGELPGENEADGGLDFSGGESRLLVVAAQFASFAGDALENVVDERVHDGHGAARDAGVGVDLLQDLVDVGRVRLSAGLAAAAAGGSLAFASFASFGTRFTFSSFGGHN